MGGSDYASDASTASYDSVGSKKKSKKDKKEKKEKKEKEPKDKDKKEKKDKDKKDKKKDEDKDKDKHKDDKDKEKDKDKKKDKDKDKHKDGKEKKHSDSAQASSSSSYPGQQGSTGLVSVPAFNPNYPGASAGVAGHGTPNLGTGYHHNPVSSSGAAPAFPSGPQPPPSVPQPSLYPGQVPKMSYDQQTPPSGYRTPLDSHDGKPFPTDFQEVGPPVSSDLDGSPIFIGSVLFDNAVHPCKIGPHLNPPAQVAYGGVEQGHSGRYDLLPFVPEQMEWVPTGHGQIPHGRRPVEGGYEEGGEKLYHAMAYINGVRVPGKTGEHLGGANVGFGGGEHNIPENYEILCWRY